LAVLGLVLALLTVVGPVGSAQATGYSGTITLTSAADTVSATNPNTTLTVTASQPVPSGYLLSVYDGTTRLSSNGSQSFGFGVAVPNGEGRTYQVYLSADFPDSSLPSTTIASSNRVTVANVGWVGTVTLTATPTSGLTAAAPYVTLTATLSKTTGSPYLLSIYDNGTRMTGCVSTCQVNNRPVGTDTHLFTAIVSQDPWPDTALPSHDVRAISQIMFSNGTGYRYSAANLDSASDSTNPQCSCADPVNTATGAWWQTMTDLTLPGRFPVAWTRTVASSKAGVDGPLGFGWATPFTSHVIAGATASDPAVLVDENGAQTSFAPAGPGPMVTAFLAPPNTHATLSRNASTGEWTYVRRQALTMTFRSDGQLKTLTDRNGETVTLTYDTATPARLQSVSTPDGRTLTFAWTGTHITTVSGPSATGVPARVFQYGFDGNGDLTSVIDSRGKTWLYGYDAAHRVTSSTSPAGGVTSIAYDTSGRAHTVTDPRNKTTTFDYTDTTVDGLARRVTRMTDPTGVITDYDYLAGWLQARTIAAGTPGASTWRFAYDPAGNTVHELDPTGVNVTSTYDANGNRLTRTAPAGAADNDGAVATGTTTWTYNSFNEPLSQIDAANHSTVWTYDSSGNLLTRVIELNATQSATTTYHHATTAHPADVTSIDDPRGNVMSFTYTAEGFVLTRTTPAGSQASGATGDTADTTLTTKYSYTPYGEIRTAIDPRGNASGATAANYTTSSTYDNAGLTITTTTPLGLITTYGYDLDGNPTTVKNNTNRTWTTYRLPNGLVDHVTDPLGHTTTTYGYDDDGRITSQTDATGNVTTYTYDDHGRLATRTKPAGNVSGASPATHAANTTTYNYDLAGRLTSTTVPDPAGGAPLASLNVYDTAGRLWKAIDPAGATTIYAYDTLNRPTSVTDPTAAATTTGYDYAGRPTTLTDPRGKTTTTTYDLAGNVIKVVDPLVTSTSPNKRTTTQQYDAAGRLWKVVSPRGNASGAVAANFTTTYAYDPLGNVRTVTDALAHVTKTTYDRDARVATTVNAKGRTTTRTYDTTSRLWKITAPDSGVTVFGYDNADRRTSVTAPMLGVWQSGYDDAGRLTTQTSPSTTVRTYSYTPNGDLATITTPRGTVTRATNPLGQLTGLTYTDATPAVSLTYDRAGRRATMTDGAGSVAYTYDGADRPLSIARTPSSGPVSTWTYTYDAAGNVATRTRPDTTVETYTYDAAGQATQVIGPSGTLTWAYDDDGNPTTTTLPNATTETYAWDRAGAAASITTKKASTVRTSQTITRDAANQPTKIVVVRNGTTETRSYLYDTNERITNVCYAASCTAGTSTQAWTYDKNGNRLTEQNGLTPGVITTTTYDSADRIATTKTGSASTITPTYDADGNLTADGAGRSWTYGLDTQTRTATTAGATTTYSYDGDGEILSATTSGTGASTKYTWDDNQPLPLLAQAVTDPDGTGPAPATTTINRFDSLGALTSVTAASTTGFVAHDPVGSITDLTDATGTISRSYDYTPYGAPRTAIGAPSSPNGPPSNIGYSGGLNDPNGQIYLHARRYDPGLGQFTQVDPAGFNGSAGYSGGYASPYNYVNGRTTTFRDPSGRACTSDWLSGQSCYGMAAAGIITGLWHLGTSIASRLDPRNPGIVQDFNACTTAYNSQPDILGGSAACLDALNPIAGIGRMFSAANDAANCGDIIGAFDNGTQAAVSTAAIVYTFGEAGSVTAGTGAGTGRLSGLRGRLPSLAEDTGSIGPRDVHGGVSGGRGVDVAHVVENGELYIQDDGQLVRVLDNGNGTSDVVVRDPANPSGRPTTQIKDMPNSQIQSRIESGRWG
jgi:RHS repeat-associated protein